MIGAKRFAGAPNVVLKEMKGSSSEGVVGMEERSGGGEERTAKKTFEPVVEERIAMMESVESVGRKRRGVGREGIVERGVEEGIEEKREELPEQGVVERARMNGVWFLLNGI